MLVLVIVLLVFRLIMSVIGFAISGGRPVVDPVAATEAPDGETVDGRRPLVDLFRDLRTSRAGLSVREATHRQVVHGPNEPTRRTGRRRQRGLALAGQA